MSTWRTDTFFYLVGAWGHGSSRLVVAYFGNRNGEFASAASIFFYTSALFTCLQNILGHHWSSSPFINLSQPNPHVTLTFTLTPTKRVGGALEGWVWPRDGHRARASATSGQREKVGIGRWCQRCGFSSRAFILSALKNMFPSVFVRSISACLPLLAILAVAVCSVSWG